MVAAGPNSPAVPVPGSGAKAPAGSAGQGPASFQGSALDQRQGLPSRHP